MRGERKKAEEGEGEEGRRRGRKGGEEIDSCERGKDACNGIVSVAREKGGAHTRTCKRGGRDSGRERKNKEKEKRGGRRRER